MNCRCSAPPGNPNGAGRVHRFPAGPDVPVLWLRREQGVLVDHGLDAVLAACLSIKNARRFTSEISKTSTKTFTIVFEIQEISRIL